MSSPSLRVGAVPYLNGRPLVAYLEQPHAAPEVEIMLAVPSRLADLLSTGALDVALLSSIEAFRRPEVAVVDGVCIAAYGPVRSVRLLSNVPFEQIGTMASDEGSLTSVALAQIVLAQRYGAKPAIFPALPEPSAMLSRADAALVIGDVAMRPHSVSYTLDLGEAWRELTGLPFVYALWIARNANVAAMARPLLLKAKEWGLRRIRNIALEWASRMRVAPDRPVDYLENVIQYDLDAPKKQAIARFEELCVAHGVCNTTYAARYI